MRYAATAAVLLGAALADPLTTFNPCPAAPTPFPDITVTKQYQPVSFCVPTSTCDKDTCVTHFPMSTSVYVSTVIPCAVDGTSASSCTITATDQEVPCSQYVSTLTSVTPVVTVHVSGTHTETGTSWSSAYQTVTKKWSAPYDKIGPLAIPGYEGSGLCEECGKGEDGSQSQYFDIDECHVMGEKQPVCQNYPFSYVSKPAPSSTAPASAVITHQASVSQPGTYTYTFPQVAPEVTFVANGHTYVAPAEPWYAYVSQIAHGPTTFNIQVTVTKVITYHVPQPKTPDNAKQTKQWPNWSNWPKPTPSQQGQNWNNWPSQKPSQKPSPTPNGPPKATQSNPWNNWPPQKPSHQPDPPKSTPANPWGNWPPTTTPGHNGPSSTTKVWTTTGSGDIGETAPADPNDVFIIQVIINANQRFRKRSDTKYIGFGGDDGVLVQKDGASKFFFDSHADLKCGGEYINQKGSGYIVWEKQFGRPGGPQFHGGKGKPLTIPGGSFCVVGDTIFISFTSSPANCIPCQLQCQDPVSSTTTTTATAHPTTTSTASPTTTTWTTTTTSSEEESNTTTTTTRDVSADLEVPDPTPEPGTSHKVRRVRRARH